MVKTLLGIYFEVALKISGLRILLEKFLQCGKRCWEIFWSSLSDFSVKNFGGKVFRISF